MRTVAASEIRRALSAIVLGALLLIAPSARAGDARDAQPGMRVYRDPTTGAFTNPPAGTTLPAEAHALSTSAETLVETPGTTAAGGVLLDLRGGFQSTITATVDDAGHVGTHCRSSADPAK